MHQPRIGRVLLATAASAAVALIAAPVASAGPHTGCYRPTADRVLRVIPKAESCLQGERRISWNNTRDGAGKRGPRGLQGISGAKGDKGDAGVAGAKGDRGETGAAGAAGAKGEKGDQGEQGLQGLQGVQGQVGAPGATGAQGPAGATGATGATGAAGEQGPQGPQGIQGPQGPQGVEGQQGPQGDAGPEGDVGPQGPQGIQGPQGEAGADGEDGAPGAGTIFSSNSGVPAVATSIAGGLAGSVTTMPPNGTGLETGVPITGGQIARIQAPSGFDHGQVIARDGTITAVNAQTSLAAAMALVGTTVTQQVSVWKASTAGSDYSPIPGAMVTLSPSLTGILPIGTTADGTVTGLSIPVVAGDRLLVVYSVTSAGVQLINTVSARVTSSIAIS